MKKTITSQIKKQKKRTWKFPQIPSFTTAGALKREQEVARKAIDVD